MGEKLLTYKNEVGVDSEKINIMIAALQKQKPMKPTYDKRLDEYSCPDCGTNFYDEDADQNVYYNFCSNCGQALDWSDD